LATELSDLTGENMTAAVTQALREHDKTARFAKISVRQDHGDRGGHPCPHGEAIAVVGPSLVVRRGNRAAEVRAAELRAAEVRAAEVIVDPSALLAVIPDVVSALEA
jgi:hypothetical protein